MEESYVGSSKESWMLDPKFNPKFQVSKLVIGTNFADFAPRFRLIMREARVNATSMQRMFLAQSLPDAMTDQFWDPREDQRTLDEILDYFSALYKVESDVDLETQLRNIRQDESESVVTFHSRWMKAMRQLEINGLRPPPNLELLQFLAKIRMSHEIRLMRPSIVLQAVEFAAQLARESTLRRIATSDVRSRKRTQGFRPRSVSVITLKCWNCGDAGHTSQGCSKPQDEATVARNRKEFRARGKRRPTVGAVERKRERRRLARIVLPVGEVQLRYLIDSSVEVSLIDCEVLKCLDPCNYVLDDNKEDTFLSINGSEFVSVGKAVVTLASGKKVPFVVASDLVHEVVLGIDILDNATFDLAHGVAVSPNSLSKGN
jgi:hypothetical protein